MQVMLIYKLQNHIKFSFYLLIYLNSNIIKRFLVYKLQTYVMLSLRIIEKQLKSSIIVENILHSTL